jgi:hypothetical protein
MTGPCNHAVGTATVDYHPEILCADDDGDSAAEKGFYAFSFCPYCGASVTAEAAEVARRIQGKWAAFWSKNPHIITTP